MELRESAEPVLFATTLEQKPRTPELITDEQSMGCTPGVLVFNPFAEGYMAYGRSFTPVKHQALLADDLANLPQFLCGADDIVLLRRQPSLEFLSSAKRAGFALPEFIELKTGRIEPGDTLTQRKIGRLRPWAWGPDSVELLEPLFAKVTGEARPASQCFNDGIAQLYSKAWSADFLRRILSGHGAASDPHLQATEPRAKAATVDAEPWLCTEQEAGVVVDTLVAALGAIAAIRQRGHHRVVAKEAHGLAGHNAIRLWEAKLTDPQRQWLARALQGGRQMVVEPWLERVLDFSIQLEMEPAGLKLCGYTGLVNDARGQFQANSAAANDARRIPANVASLFRKPADITSRIQRLYSHIFSLLEADLRRVSFLGPVSIDAFVYRKPDGSCRLKPIVELNPRYTMGRLTVELMKQCCPGSSGLLRLFSRAQARAQGFTDFASYARSLAERFPLRLEGEPVPKIREGAFSLNDPTQAQVCLATFQVAPPGERLA